MNSLNIIQSVEGPLTDLSKLTEASENALKTIGGDMKFTSVTVTVKTKTRRSLLENMMANLEYTVASTKEDTEMLNVLIDFSKSQFSTEVAKEPSNLVGYSFGEPKINLSVAGSGDTSGDTSVNV